MHSAHLRTCLRAPLTDAQNRMEKHLFLTSAFWATTGEVSQGKPSSGAHPSTGACSWKNEPPLPLIPQSADPHFGLKGLCTLKCKNRTKCTENAQIFQPHRRFEKVHSALRVPPHCLCTAHSSWLKGSLIFSDTISERAGSVSCAILVTSECDMIVDVRHTDPSSSEIHLSTFSSLL